MHFFPCSFYFVRGYDFQEVVKNMKIISMLAFNCLFPFCHVSEIEEKKVALTGQLI